MEQHPLIVKQNFEETMEDYTSPKDNSTAFSRASETVQFLEKQLPEALQRPRLGVICGSGLGSLVETILPQPTQEVPYTSIPHFPSISGRYVASQQAKRFIHTHAQQCMAMPANLCLG